MNPEEHKRSSKSEIEDLIKARYSLIYITSSEEARVEESLRKLCVEREMRLEIWSITEGFKTVANGQGTRDAPWPLLGTPGHRNMILMALIHSFYRARIEASSRSLAAFAGLVYSWSGVAIMCACVVTRTPPPGSMPACDDS